MPDLKTSPNVNPFQSVVNSMEIAAKDQLTKFNANSAVKTFAKISLAVAIPLACLGAAMTTGAIVFAATLLFTVGTLATPVLIAAGVVGGVGLLAFLAGTVTGSVIILILSKKKQLQSIDFELAKKEINKLEEDNKNIIDEQEKIKVELESKKNEIVEFKKQLSEKKESILNQKNKINELENDLNVQTNLSKNSGDKNIKIINEKTDLINQLTNEKNKLDKDLLDKTKSLDTLQKEHDILANDFKNNITLIEKINEIKVLTKKNDNQFHTINDLHKKINLSTIKPETFKKLEVESEKNKKEIEDLNKKLITANLNIEEQKIDINTKGDLNKELENKNKKLIQEIKDFTYNVNKASDKIIKQTVNSLTKPMEDKYNLLIKLFKSEITNEQRNAINDLLQQSKDEEKFIVDLMGDLEIKKSKSPNKKN